MWWVGRDSGGGRIQKRGWCEGGAGIVPRRCQLFQNWSCSECRIIKKRQRLGQVCWFRVAIGVGMYQRVTGGYYPKVCRDWGDGDTSHEWVCDRVEAEALGLVQVQLS